MIPVFNCMNFLATGNDASLWSCREKIRALIVIVSLLASSRTREWRYDRVITSYYMYALELLQT